MEVKINLIPDYKKKEIAQTYRVKKIALSGIVMLAVTFIFLIFLQEMDSVLDIKYEAVILSQERSQDKSLLAKINNMEQYFDNTNKDVQKILNIRNDQIFWSKMFTEIGDDMMPGISLTSLSTKEYVIFLVGRADSRENLTEFKNRLEKDDCFTNINLPLSNLVSQKDIDFQMDLSVKEGCIKNK